jgi:hypothetical protein
MFGMLTLVAISFYSIGGLGSFVALFGTPEMRTWSRLYVIIALFGLLAVGYWVTVVGHKHRLLELLIAAALLVTGVLDQTNPALAPHYQTMRTEVANLTAFSRRIEARVAPGCSVFQLPIADFPNNIRINNMESYAQLRPYLTSSSLRWSYGAFDGTSLADWQLTLPQKSTSALLDDLVAAGFCAVEVDRAGFADRAAALQSSLTKSLGDPISRTRDDRLVAWNLAPQRASLTSRIGAERIKAAGDLVLHPVVVYADAGAFSVEHDNQIPYQWIGPSAVIDIHNFGRSTLGSVSLRFSLAAPDSAARRFTVHVPDSRTQEVDVSGGIAREVHVVVNMRPGRNAVTITTTGNAVSVANVDGKIVFGKLINLQSQLSDPGVHMSVVQQEVN